MSHRTIKRDPVAARREAYQGLEKSGEQMEAVIEAFEALSMQGIDLGGKMAALLAKRKDIKRKNVK